MERRRGEGKKGYRRGEDTRRPCVNNALVAALVVEINATGAI